MRMMAVWLVAAFAAGGCAPDASYQVTVEPHGTKILTGRITPEIIESDSTMGWYRSTYAAFTPDSATIAFLSIAAQDIHFVVVAGTWCSDTKRELPKFFKTLALAHIPQSNVELYGVDRMKKSNDGVTDQYGIERVPTFILLSKGKEIGRIVESVQKGMEFDLAVCLKGQK